MRRRCRTWIAVVVLLLAVGFAGLVTYVYQLRFVGTTHEILLSEPPAFLTEEAALAAARETLTRDGLDPAVWSARPDGRSTAPDGRRDEFVSRNALNPNQGSVRFSDNAGRDRFVSVELLGDRLFCHGSWGK